LLKKIVYAGSNNPAIQRGSQDLVVLAEVTVPAKQVERLTERIGHERQAERDSAVVAYPAPPLAQHEDPPPDKTAPQLAVVEMDGSRLQIRAAKAKPDEMATLGTVTSEGPTAATAPSVASVPGASAAASKPDSAADRAAWPTWSGARSC
jgi:hypothetical protein